MANKALEFAFKYADNKCYGYNVAESLKITSEQFKRSIVAIAIRKRTDGEQSHRRYYFNDDTALIFQNNEFQLCRRSH